VPQVLGGSDQPTHAGELSDRTGGPLLDEDVVDHGAPASRDALAGASGGVVGGAPSLRRTVQPFEVEVEVAGSENAQGLQLR
jgi:hypothetical protein